MSKTVAIPGINGAQQAAIAAAFHDAGWRVRPISRHASDTPYGPAAVANAETGEGLAQAFTGADAIVVTLPQDHRDGAMTRLARSVAHAADAAGAGRLVFNVAATIAEDDPRPVFSDLRAARDAVTAAKTPSVVLQPTVFMDNLLAPWSLPGIVNDGVLAYPAPEDVAISWISHRTLAAYAVAAASRPDAIGKAFRIGGPAPLTGRDLVTTLSGRIGKPVAYAQIPLDGFAAGLNAAFGAPAGDRIATLYRRLEIDPHGLSVDGSSQAALGVTPESFADFAARQAWRL